MKIDKKEIEWLRKMGAQSISIDGGELSSVSFYEVNLEQTVAGLHDEVERQIIDEMGEEEREMIESKRKQRMAYLSSP